MLAGTLTFAAGIFCLLQFSQHPGFWPLLCLPLLFFLGRYSKGCKIILFFCLGFCWALLRVSADLSDPFDPAIEGRVIRLTGVVSSMPKVYAGHVEFLFDVDDVIDDKKQHFPFSGTVRLKWYKTKEIPVPGEKWQFSAKLKRPYSFMNPGGFDYETWLFRQGIKATGYVRKHNINQRLALRDGYYIERFRYALAQEIKHYVDKPLQGLVLALSLGDRSQLDSDQWRVFTHTGTNHLIAISGLHLGLIAGFIFFLTRTLWRQFYIATQFMPASTIAAIVAFLGAFFYAALAGFSLPTQRALIMIAVFLWGLLSARQLISSSVVCIAIVLILIMEPLAIIAVDFWLSFAAVILILYITRYRISAHNNLSRWLRLQCMLSLALFPLLIFWFKQVPVYSVLANLIAIPVIGFLVVPLILLAIIFIFPFPLVSAYIFGFIDKINNLHWSYLDMLSQLPYAIMPIATSNKGILLLAMIGVFILCMPKGLPARWIGLFFLLPLVFPPATQLKAGEFKFSLLDVGQGLSAVIQTRKHTLVYDTGARFSERFNIGNAVLTPYLRVKGVNHIAMLMVSHGDNDHIGGANALLENFNIGKILTSVPQKFSRNLATQCYAGQQWTWDGVAFEVLHPGLESKFTGNNASCVLKVSSPRGAVLLTGDIEWQAEKMLLKNAREKIQADILLVPHHGSRTSSSNEFISAVAPKYAFFPAGYGNRFGLPKQAIISRYDAHGVESRVSYKTGELSVELNAEGLIIEQFRSKNRRLWHH